MSMNSTPGDRRRGPHAPDMHSGAVAEQAVLIVEDQAVIRALLRDFLQSSFPGLAISEAADGRRALQLARERRPHVVLMDVNLPDANGIELAAQIKALLPDTRVIMVTSLAGSAYLERARAAGAFGYVAKEKIFSELLPVLARALAAAPGNDAGGGGA